MRGTKRKRSATPPSTDAVAGLSLNPLRAGMPAQDSIIGVKEFRKGQKVYRIIKTNEVDEYEQPPPKTKGKKRRADPRSARR